MDLDQLITIEPAAFKQLLEEDYFDNNGIYIIRVYNALMRSAQCAGSTCPSCMPCGSCRRGLFRSRERRRDNFVP